MATAALTAAAGVTAAARVPGIDGTIWWEAAALAGSAGAIMAVTWWLTGRHPVPDQRPVLTWGVGAGLALGALWMAEIAFNNLGPRSVATAAARGIVDNTVWAIVAAVMVAVAVGVTVTTRRGRSGLRAASWAGVVSGLGAALGGATLLAAYRTSVEGDPLMVDEWRQQGEGVDLSVYVTRDTMAGVLGHLWVLGVVQGVLLGLIAASVTVAVLRLRIPSAGGTRSEGTR